MKIAIIRDIKGKKSTQGVLFVNGVHVGYTLEPQHYQDDKLPCVKGCIPSGCYPVKLNYSSHFRGYRPYLSHIKGYEGVMIHEGNNALDTLGCILVAKNRTTKGIQGCKVLLDSIMKEINEDDVNKIPTSIVLLDNWDKIDEYESWFPASIITDTKFA